MIKKENIIEQYVEILAGKDYNNWENKTYSAYLTEAKQLYLKERIGSVFDAFNETTKENDARQKGMCLGKDWFKGVNPEIACSAPTSFINVKMGMQLPENTAEDRKVGEDFLSRAIEQGVNIEAVKRQAYERIKVIEQTSGKGGFDQTVDRNTINELKSVISFCDENEMMSPFYPLKEAQRRIFRYQENMSKYPERKEFFTKRIEEEENKIYDFLDDCESQGIDSELADEYLSDYKRNYQTEKQLRQKAIINLNDLKQNSTDEKVSSDNETSKTDATRAQYKSQARSVYENGSSQNEQNNKQQEEQEPQQVQKTDDNYGVNSRIEHVSEEEILDTRRKHLEEFGLSYTDEEWQQKIIREEQERMAQEANERNNGYSQGRSR